MSVFLDHQRGEEAREFFCFVLLMLMVLVSMEDRRTGGHEEHDGREEDGNDDTRGESQTRGIQRIRNVPADDV